MKITLQKVVFLIISIVGFSCIGFAQQEAQFTQYMFNRLSFNPAYAGSSGSICASALYRNQWMGLKLTDPSGQTPATPQNFLFSIDAPVPFLHGGLGGTVFTDKIGWNKSIVAKLDYAFRFYWGPGNMSIGIEGSFFNSTLDYGKLRGNSSLTGNPNNPILDASSDPLLQSKGEMSDFMVDLSAGLYYQIPGVMYAGISTVRALETTSEELHYTNRRYYYLTAGTEHPLPANPSIKIMPSLLFRTDLLSGFQFDISGIAEYEKLFWVGLSYRLQDAVAILGGLSWNNLKIGLSYDITTSGLGYMKSGRSHGSLEIFARYCFKIIVPPKPPTIYGNTRYFL